MCEGGVTPIKTLIEESTSFGDRTVVNLLQFNQNKVQRLFELQGWLVQNRLTSVLT